MRRNRAVEDNDILTVSHGEFDERLLSEEKRDEDSMLTMVARQMKAAPWYLCSTMVHIVLLGLMMLVPTVPDHVVRNFVIIKTPDFDMPEEEEEKIVEPEEKTHEEIFRELVDETVKPENNEKIPDVAFATDVPVVDTVPVEPSEEAVSDPSEPAISSEFEEPAPNILGFKGSLSASNAVGSGFRGNFGKIGDRLRGMVGADSGGNGSRGLCLIWLLDQSGSMKDDQEKLARQARDIQDLLTDGGKKKMLSGVVTFGQNWLITQPLTESSSRITDAILNVEIDKSGRENTNQAIIYTCEEIMAAKNGWTKVIVLLSDESASDQRSVYNGKVGPDGKKLALAGLNAKSALMDLALATLVKTKTRLFVIGKESPFQQNSVYEPYIDDEGDRWVLEVDRGPESPEMEVPLVNAVRMDHYNRESMVDNYVKSGYGVYDYAYLSKASRGAYFILDESVEADRRPLSPSERARYPFKIDWKTMDQYSPLLVARSDYKNALFKTAQGKKI